MSSEERYVEVKLVGGRPVELFLPQRSALSAIKPTMPKHTYYEIFAAKSSQRTCALLIGTVIRGNDRSPLIRPEVL